MGSQPYYSHQNQGTKRGYCYLHMYIHIHHYHQLSTRNPLNLSRPLRLPVITMRSTDPGRSASWWVGKEVRMVDSKNTMGKQRSQVNRKP